MQLRSPIGLFFIFFGLILFELPIRATSEIEIQEAENETDYRVTYIGNAGVMISWQDKRILIDALHHNGNPYYTPIPESRRRTMAAGKPPFDGIDLILATHVHPDHFDLTSVGDCLTNDSTTTFISSKQACEFLELAYSGFRSIKKQVRSVDLDWFERGQISLPGMSLTVLGMKHNAPFNKIRNSGFIIELGNLKFLHIGDAELMTENFEPYNLPHLDIDVAFIPYWYLTSSVATRKLVNEKIGPKNIIAIHVPPAEAEKIRQETLEIKAENGRAVRADVTWPTRRAIISG